MRLIERFTGRDNDPSNSLGSLADLMSALMLVFLMIAIALMSHAQNERRKAEQSLAEATKLRTQHDELIREREAYRPYFEAYEAIQTTRASLATLLKSKISEEDLKRWKAEFNENTLAYRFNDPETLFGAGSAQLSPRFAQILEEFIPALLGALEQGDAYHQVSSIRIEGHTSSEWADNNDRITPRVAHIRNMNLSQARAFAVVEYLSSMTSIESSWDGWTRQRIQALGVGPNRLILDETTGAELPKRSRRVEVWIVPREVKESLETSIEDIAKAEEL